MQIIFDDADISDIHPTLKKRMESYHFEVIGWSKKIETRKVKDAPGDTYHSEIVSDEPQTWTFKLKTTKTHGELIK